MAQSNFPLELNLRLHRPVARNGMLTSDYRGHQVSLILNPPLPINDQVVDHLWPQDLSSRTGPHFHLPAMQYPIKIVCESKTHTFCPACVCIAKHIEGSQYEIKACNDTGHFMRNHCSTKAHKKNYEKVFGLPEGFVVQSPWRCNEGCNDGAVRNDLIQKHCREKHQIEPEMLKLAFHRAVPASEQATGTSFNGFIAKTVMLSIDDANGLYSLKEAKIEAIQLTLGDPSASNKGAPKRNGGLREQLNQATVQPTGGPSESLVGHHEGGENMAPSSTLPAQAGHKRKSGSDFESASGTGKKRQRLTIPHSFTQAAASASAPYSDWIDPFFSQWEAELRASGYDYLPGSSRTPPSLSFEDAVSFEAGLTSFIQALVPLAST
ncbi:hypothetical protein BXZ70DRAFT_233846 [Cristinia sonorae]|uniref:Uncharacterized protein n=1 Tax=Cristinia sonorae TaxID=1940300 RepID=A0A8K0ULH1_9AGAR|nr:hypothetical protein BXZ70DRAFT_233846 [Cristinia sonorae]